jgi:hypothetical protein
LDRAALILLSIGIPLSAQTIDYACIPRFRADPGVIRISEASGGQVLLLSPGEIANPAVAQAQANFSDPMILRASGTLTGRVHEFTTPVDSTVRAVQFTVFAECVKSVTITAPSGAEAEGVRFSTGRIVMLDSPEPGIWKVKLAGTGYFSVIAQVKSPLSMTLVGFELAGVGQDQKIVARLSGPIASARFELLSREGATLETLSLARSDNRFEGSFTAPAQPFRIAVEGQDSAGAAFRRVQSVLFSAPQ